MEKGYDFGVGAIEIFCGYPSFQRIPKIFQIFNLFQV